MPVMLVPAATAARPVAVITDVPVVPGPLSVTTGVVRPYNPVPVSVNASAALLLAPVVGDMAAIVGPPTVNFITFDTAPVPGFLTVISAVPAVTRRAAETVAYSTAVGLMTGPLASANVTPFHRTWAGWAPVAKLEPFTVSVNDGPPTAAETGSSDVMTGAVVVVI